MNSRRIMIPALLALVALLAAFLPRQPERTWTLPEVLAALTRSAPALHSLSADAAVVDYTALVQESDRSWGHLDFERGAHGPRYALDLDKPAASAKKLLYVDHTAYVYTPSAKQVMKYSLDAHPDEVNQYLLLGMGATGKDLEKSFSIQLDGPAMLDGRRAVELTLIPKSASLKDKLTRLDIWYDPTTWVGIQQRMWQPGGDYHLLTLTHIEINPPLSDKIFSTAFPGATVVTPHF